MSAYSDRAGQPGQAGDERAAPPMVESLEAGLEEIFDFEDFRPGQRDVMEAVLRGINSLVVMPTGSGKSLCYQLPACVLDGITLVISPLIALMKDQVDALDTFGVPATFINSSISTNEQRDRIHDMEHGHYKVVYIAPERFRSPTFCDAIANTKVGLLAIDEAHCISQWGHDFRPDYLRLAEVRDQLGHPPTIALTATATRQVQHDILEQLNLPEAEIFVYGFERPNLFFEVFDCRSKGDKIDRIQALMNHYPGESLLIYCATRKQVEEVSRELDGAGISVGSYHGGLSERQRERIQDAFMRDEFAALVATNAFGMGVDKPDIRAVVHYNIPGSIEAYYQEGGRAGRDGEPAHCLMLFNYNDRGIHEFFNEQSYPTQATIERVWEHCLQLGLGTHHVGPDELTRSSTAAAAASASTPGAWRPRCASSSAAGTSSSAPATGSPGCRSRIWRAPRDLRVDWEYHQRSPQDQRGPASRCGALCLGADLPPALPAALLQQLAEL